MWRDIFAQFPVNKNNPIGSKSTYFVMSDSDLFSKIGFLQRTEYKVRAMSQMRNTPESRNLEFCNLFSERVKNNHWMCATRSEAFILQNCGEKTEIKNLVKIC